MLDIKLFRTNPDLIKENLKKKFQEHKLALVDEIVELDKQFRESKTQGDNLRSQRNTFSKQIGSLMGKGQKEEAEQMKAKVAVIAKEMADHGTAGRETLVRNTHQNAGDPQYY
jgi:seryl-tRNA synthetase